MHQKEDRMCRLGAKMLLECLTKQHPHTLPDAAAQATVIDLSSLMLPPFTGPHRTERTASLGVPPGDKHMSCQVS
jgi:hypothetical protein